MGLANQGQMFYKEGEKKNNQVPLMKAISIILNNIFYKFFHTTLYLLHFHVFRSRESKVISYLIYSKSLISTLQEMLKRKKKQLPT